MREWGKWVDHVVVVRMRVMKKERSLVFDEDEDIRRVKIFCGGDEWSQLLECWGVWL